MEEIFFDENTTKKNDNPLSVAIVTHIKSRLFFYLIFCRLTFFYSQFNLSILS
jgi:hypothetical protein